jgi:selenocysteine-specific elongation factor
MRTAGTTSEMVRALAQRGDLVRLSDDVAFTKEAYDQAVFAVRELIATTGSVTVAQLRDRLQASRRPILALLEHLDSAKVTRRVGDARVLR